MLMEAYIGSVAFAWLHSLTFETRKKWKIEREISYIFNTTMRINLREDEKQKFEIKYYTLTDYGFDLFLDGNKADLNDLLKFIPNLEQKYDGQIVAESSKGYIRARVWLNGIEISLTDRLHFEFNNAYSNIRNSKGETFEVLEVVPLIREGTNIGFNMEVSIPGGLSYALLSKYSGNLDSLGTSFLKWNKDKKVAEIEIITNTLDKVDYKPLKCEPWQMYFGNKSNYEPLIVDYSITPNAFIVGIPNSGKTRTMMQGILNNILCNKTSKLAIATTEKEDLRIFKDCENCDYYANNLTEINNMLDLLIKEMEGRNKLINQHSMCFNIFDYNLQSNEKMEFIHLVNDEISDLMVGDEKDKDYKIKNEITEKLIHLGRKGRSVGIYLTLATQRSDSISLNPRLKALLCNQIIFSQANEQSAKLVLGEGNQGRVRLALNLDKVKREFLYNSHQGFGIATACNLDNDIIIDTIKNIPKKIIPISSDKNKVVNIKKKKQNSGRWKKAQ